MTSSSVRLFWQRHRRPLFPVFGIVASLLITATTTPAVAQDSRTGRRSARRLPRPVQPRPLPPAPRVAPTPRRRLAQPAVPSTPQRASRRGASRYSAPRPTPVATKPVPGKPWLVWNDTSYDFGRKLVSEKVEGEFAFRNDGEAELHVTQVRASCGCTATNYDRLVKPGETGKVRFSIDPKRVHGRTTKTISVTTDCPGHPRTTLTVRGEVYRLIEVKPRPTVAFRVTDPNEPLTQTLELISNTQEPFEITSIEGANSTFAAKVEPIEPGKKYRVEITATPPFKQGPNIGRFTLATSLERQPEVQVTASAYVMPRVRISPTTLYAVVGPAVSAQKRNISVINTGKTPVEIQEVKVSDAALKTELVDNPRTNSKYVQVTVPANYEVPTGGAFVTIVTNDEEFKEFKVPVRVRKSPGVARPPVRPRASLPRARPPRANVAQPAAGGERDK